MYNELKTNIVQIEIDNGSGFCFGVTTAIKKAEEELAKGGKLYCLGDIVHNGMEVERLHEAGLITIDHEQMEELQGVKVLLRAHGEPPETYALAERNNIEIIDATCPVVLQLQRRIKKQYVNNPEAQIVIFGKNGHAEVLGLVGQTESHAIVVEKFEDVKQLKETGQLDFSKDIYLYSQTTKSLDEFHRIIEYCQEHIVVSKENVTLSVEQLHRNKYYKVTISGYAQEFYNGSWRDPQTYDTLKNGYVAQAWKQTKDFFCSIL